MKHVLLALFVFTFSCSPKSDKPLTLEEIKAISTDSVKAFIQRTAHNPTSYQAVSTDITPFTLQDSLMKELDKAEDILDTTRHTKTAPILKRLKETAVINDTVGYIVSHSFRSTNPLGATVLNTYEFTFDKKLNITEAKPLNN